MESTTPTRGRWPPSESPTSLDELQGLVRSVKVRHGFNVSPVVALLDICAELGELAGAYLKETNYAPERAVDVRAERVRTEYGDVLFAILSLADAAGLSARDELLTTLARYEDRFSGP